MMIQEHPLRILRHAKGTIWLLIIPILRGIRSFTLDIDAFYTWITGVWIDIVVLLFIIGIGYLSWLFTWVRLGRNHIRLMQGFIVKRTIEIPYKNISAVTAQHSFYLRPFKAVRVNINTDAGVLGAADMTIMVRRDDFKLIQKKLPKIRHAEKKTFKFRPKWHSILFFSFVFSSSLSGALYISTLIFSAGRIAVDLMREEIADVYKAANDVSQNVSDNIPMEIPPIVIILIAIVLGTWLLSFFSNIFRYYDFVMKKDGHIMRIVSGAFTKRVFHIMPRKINYLDLRQSFITKSFNKSSLNINCSGYGKDKNELPVLLPILAKNEINEALEMLGFNKHMVKRAFKPQKRAFMTYIGVPLLIAGMILAAGLVTYRLLGQLRDIMPFITVFLEVPVCWLIIVKLRAFFTTGITIEDDFCCIKYSRFYAYHTILADTSKLVKVQVIQNFIDKRIGRCRMKFNFSSEKAKSHYIKGIGIKDALKIIRQLNIGENSDILVKK